MHHKLKNDSQVIARGCRPAFRQPSVGLASVQRSMQGIFGQQFKGCSKIISRIWPLPGKLHGSADECLGHKKRPSHEWMSFIIAPGTAGLGFPLANSALASITAATNPSLRFRTAVRPCFFPISFCPSIARQDALRSAFPDFIVGEVSALCRYNQDSASIVFPFTP